MDKKDIYRQVTVEKSDGKNDTIFQLRKYKLLFDYEMEDYPSDSQTVVCSMYTVQCEKCVCAFL